jgi:leader peptidase (prepilin peptidase)/N-methyltransferase
MNLIGPSAYLVEPSTPATVVALFALLVTLAAASLTDLRTRRIPNRLTLASALLAVTVAAAQGPQYLVLALAAALAVSLPLFVLAMVRPEGLGMGDAKLVAVLGLYLGWAAWPALLFSLLLAGLTGAFVAVATRTPPSRTALPLAPFIAFGTLSVLLPPFGLLQ